MATNKTDVNDADGLAHIEEVDYAGSISKRSDTQLRAFLYEAAMVILTRTTADSALLI